MWEADSVVNFTCELLKVTALLNIHMLVEETIEIGRKDQCIRNRSAYFSGRNEHASADTVMSQPIRGSPAIRVITMKAVGTWITTDGMGMVVRSVMKHITLASETKPFKLVLARWRVSESSEPKDQCGLTWTRHLLLVTFLPWNWRTFLIERPLPGVQSQSHVMFYFATFLLQ